MLHISLCRDAVPRCILKHLPQWTPWAFSVTWIPRERERERESDLEGLQASFLESETFILFFNNVKCMTEAILGWGTAKNKRRRDRGGELMWKFLGRTNFGFVRRCRHCLLCSLVYLMMDILYISPKALLSLSGTERLWCMKEPNSRQLWKSWWCGCDRSLGHVMSHHLEVSLSVLGAQFNSYYILPQNPLRLASHICPWRLCFLAECESVSFFSLSLSLMTVPDMEFTDEKDICQHLHSICLHCGSI